MRSIGTPTSASGASPRYWSRDARHERRGSSGPRCRPRRNGAVRRPAMRALVLRSFDGPQGLELAEVPDPPRSEDVLLDVKAVGINFPDLLATQGRVRRRAKAGAS